MTNKMSGEAKDKKGNQINISRLIISDGRKEEPKAKTLRISQMYKAVFPSMNRAKCIQILFGDQRSHHVAHDPETLEGIERKRQIRS